MTYAVNNTDTSLHAWLRNTDITLHARLSRSRLLWPIQYLPIYMFSLFYTGTSRLPPRVLASGPRPFGTMIIVVVLFALPHNSLRNGQASWTSSWRIFSAVFFRSNEEISCPFTSYMATRISDPPLSTFVHHCIPEEWPSMEESMISNQKLKAVHNTRNDFPSVSWRIISKTLKRESYSTQRNWNWNVCTFTKHLCTQKAIGALERRDCVSIVQSQARIQSGSHHLK